MTQVFDRPVQGRVLFEEVLRENLDLGRPDHVQLIFDRRVSRRTPSRHRTRVITDGVNPSLHVDYKHSRIKQYYKEGRALRTETVINNTYDFDVGTRLHNLDDLTQIGFAANRRLLRVQRVSHDATVRANVLDELNRPRVVDRQRAAALRFADPRVQAPARSHGIVSAVTGRVRQSPTARNARPLARHDRGTNTAKGRMTYDLRRLRLHGAHRAHPPHPALRGHRGRSARRSLLPTACSSGSCVRPCPTPATNRLRP